MSFQDNYHPHWQAARCDFLTERFGKAYFSGKTILELAPFNGCIGNFFHELGARVTCVEGRAENVANITQSYPHLNVKNADLDVPDWPWGDFDIIINFGLFYHLHNHHAEHLAQCLRHCQVLLFESEVVDAAHATLYRKKEQGPDQALGGQAGVPSTSYVENIFHAHGWSYEKIASAKLNGDGHVYDWPDHSLLRPGENLAYRPAHRRMWICRR